MDDLDTMASAKREASGNAAYLNDHVTAEMFREHMQFPAGALTAGDRLGPYELIRDDGNRMSTTDLLRGRPVLLILGSVTCPMTAASMPTVKRLHARFGDAVDSVMLNVREAHPGENVPQPKQLADKLDHARALPRQLAIPFPVVSDDLAGSLHRALGALPNAAFLLDGDGTIRFRALWVGDEAGIGRSLGAIAHGERPPEVQSERKLVPLAQGLGQMREMLERSGPRAVADVWQAAPQLAVVAWTASLFRPLPPLGRTAAALGLFVGAPLAAVGLILARRTSEAQDGDVR